MKPMRYRTNGYTLIELLVVIAILALIAAVAMPISTHMIQAADIRSDTYAVMTALRRCQDAAIAGQKTITIDNGTRPFADCGASDIVLSDQLVIDVKTAPSYFSDGTTTGGRIVLRYGERQASIDIAWLIGTVSREQS
jgi:general secretion pathway protein H